MWYVLYQAELEKTTSDIKFEEIEAYYNVLYGKISGVSKAATELVKRDKQVAEALFEFSQGLLGVGQSETDTLSTGLIQVGLTCPMLYIILLYAELFTPYRRDLLSISCPSQQLSLAATS